VDRSASYYDSQQPDVEIINHCESSIADSVIFYYPNGSIKGIVEYQNDLDQLKHGWTIAFDSLSGRIMNKILYSNGICLYTYDYYPNGSLKTISECFDQTEIGSKYIFDSSGMLKTYIFLNFLQFKTYSKVYKRDTPPFVDFRQNSLISQYWFSSIDGEDVDVDNGLKKNTEYFYNVAIPKPPENDRIIEISEFDEHNTRIRTTIIKDTMGIIRYPFMFDSNGKHKMEVKCVLLNGQSHKVEWSDSLKHTIKIK
jgi:antitoxin component YwqK of YwqJK toxin-antitoxin module